MRGIKFRAWHKSTHHMFNPQTLKELAVYQRTFIVDGWDMLEIMQFTGQIDMDCKEIYEGDIIQVYNAQTSHKMRVSEIWYNGQSCRFNGLALTNARLMKVIGNIYENPELMK